MSRRIALGTVQFGLPYGVANQGGMVGFEEAARILEEAALAGIDTLDTAAAYGDSELTLGRIGVGSWNIVTKLSALDLDGTDVESVILSEAEASLKRLNVERVHAVLLHRPEQLLGAQGNRLFKALQRLKSEGFAKKIGVSIYQPDELGPLMAGGDLDLVQAPLSILDRRLVESGWASRLKARGVELHARSVFLQGLLLMPPKTRAPKFGRWHDLWEEWERWLAEEQLTPLEACVRYVLSVPEIHRVVVGVDNLAQLRQILAAAQGEISGLPSWPESVAPELLNPSCWHKL